MLVRFQFKLCYDLSEIYKRRCFTLLLSPFLSEGLLVVSVDRQIFLMGKPCSLHLAGAFSLLEMFLLRKCFYTETGEHARVTSVEHIPKSATSSLCSLNLFNLGLFLSPL